MQRTPIVARAMTACLLGVAFAAAAPGFSTSVASARESSVTLSGCLVHGEGGDDGYLITNSPSEPGSARAGDSRVSPDAFGAVGGFSTVVYWLDDDGDLKPHIGHRVEVEGDLKGEPKDGEMAVERKDRWTEVTLKADGRTLRANVPHTSVEPAPGAKGTTKRGIIVRRVSVEHIRMIKADCAP